MMRAYDKKSGKYYDVLADTKSGFNCLALAEYKELRADEIAAAEKKATEQKAAQDIVDTWIRGGFKGNPWAEILVPTFIDCEEDK